MNEVFIIGKIISDIDFKFIINSKTKKSIARFTIKTKTEQKIFIRAYNDLADFVYSRFKESDNIFVYGRLSGDYVIVKVINLLWFFYYLFIYLFIYLLKNEILYVLS